MVRLHHVSCLQVGVLWRPLTVTEWQMLGSVSRGRLACASSDTFYSPCQMGILIGWDPMCGIHYAGIYSPMKTSYQCLLLLGHGIGPHYEEMQFCNLRFLSLCVASNPSLRVAPLPKRCTTENVRKLTGVGGQGTHRRIPAAWIIVSRGYEVIQ